MDTGDLCSGPVIEHYAVAVTGTAHLIDGGCDLLGRGGKSEDPGVESFHMGVSDSEEWAEFTTA